MILTVTPHSALDKVLFIDEWISGTPMRTNKIVTSVGGKGLDSSVVLRHLGVETIGLTFVAGKIGEELIQLVEQYGIVPEPVWVEGTTRVAYVIVEKKHNRHSHIIAGQLLINQDHVEDFLIRFRQQVRQAEWVICAGSIPPVLPSTFYKDIVYEAAQVGVPVLIDAAHDEILEAISARPAIIKMNWEEFSWTFKRQASTFADLIKEAQRVYMEFELGALVLTCSSAGILSFSKEGFFHTLAPQQVPVNAAGAGDAVSSALAWRFSMGDRWPEALKWAGATSAAVVLTEGTADCHLDDIQRIYPHVQVNKL